MLQISKYKNIIIYVVAFVVLGVAFGSYHKKKTPKVTAIHTLTATLAPFSSDLYFTATIQPIKVDLITSPADGTVIKKNFEYGGSIEKNQLLFIINSPQLQTDYTTALMNFLKSKQSYLRTKSSFSGTNELWKHGLIAKEEYDNEQDSLVSSRLYYLQAKNALRGFYNNPEDVEKLDNISIIDISQFEKIFSRSVEEVQIKSATSGVALFPDSGQGDKAQKVVVGSEVKKSQALVSIGDLDGVNLLVTASEININEIKVGQKVTISGPAFPDIVLNGQIVEVGFQATGSGGYGEGGVAKFPVKVVVDNLSAEQRKLIHIGMTATVKFSIKHDPAILIPIAAISYDTNTGISSVKILNPQNKSIKTVAITTGQTTLDGNVVIEKGLSANDQVIVP